MASPSPADGSASAWRSVRSPPPAVRAGAFAALAAAARRWCPGSGALTARSCGGRPVRAAGGPSVPVPAPAVAPARPRRRLRGGRDLSPPGTGSSARGAAPAPCRARGSPEDPAAVAARPAGRRAAPRRLPPRSRARRSASCATTTRHSTRGASRPRGSCSAPGVQARFGGFEVWRSGFKYTVANSPGWLQVTAAAGAATVGLTLRAGDRDACGKTVERRFAGELAPGPHGGGLARHGGGRAGLGRRALGAPSRACRLAPNCWQHPSSPPARSSRVRAPRY